MLPISNTCYVTGKNKLFLYTDYRLVGWPYFIKQAPGTTPIDNRSNLFPAHLTISALPSKCPQPVSVAVNPKSHNHLSQAKPLLHSALTAPFPHAYLPSIHRDCQKNINHHLNPYISISFLFTPWLTPLLSLNLHNFIGIYELLLSTAVRNNTLSDEIEVTTT